MILTFETALKLPYLHAGRYEDNGKATKEELEYAVKFDSDWFESTGMHAIENYKELIERLKRFDEK